MEKFTNFTIVNVFLIVFMVAISNSQSMFSQSLKDANNINGAFDGGNGLGKGDRNSPFGGNFESIKDATKNVQEAIDVLDKADKYVREHGNGGDRNSYSDENNNPVWIESKTYEEAKNFLSKYGVKLADFIATKGYNALASLQDYLKGHITEKHIIEPLIERCLGKAWLKGFRAVAGPVGFASTIIEVMSSNVSADDQCINSKGKRMWECMSAQEQKEILNTLRAEDLNDFNRKLAEAYETARRNAIKEALEYQTITIHETRKVYLDAIYPDNLRETSPRPK